jgi:hypothetical protein
MTKQQVLKIFHDYVDNDYNASGDRYYVKDALLAVADEYEIRAMGFGWILDDDDEEDEE